MVPDKGNRHQDHQKGDDGGRTRTVHPQQRRGPQAIYNRFKMMVNQVLNLRSAKWNGHDHEVVKLILRSVVFRNPTQVQLIHEMIGM
jgi:hypothetical protein